MMNGKERGISNHIYWGSDYLQIIKWRLIGFFLTKEIEIEAQHSELKGLIWTGGVCPS